MDQTLEFSVPLQLASRSSSSIFHVKNEMMMHCNDMASALSSPAVFNSLASPKTASATLLDKAAPSATAISSATKSTCTLFQGLEFDDSSASPSPSVDFFDSPSSASLSPNSTSEEEHSNTPNSAMNTAEYALSTQSITRDKARHGSASASSAFTSYSSCTHSSSNSSSSAFRRKRKSSGADVSGGGGGRAHRKKVPVSTKARLAAQRKYDEKKRVLNRRLFDNLKDSLECAARLLHGAEDTKQKTSHEEDDDETKALEDMSSREMMVKAADSIKMLNDMKAALQAKLHHLDEILDDQSLPCIPLVSTALSSQEDDLVGSTSSSDSDDADSMIVQFSSRSASSSSLSTSTAFSHASSLSEIDSLLHSISTLHRLFQDESAAVRSFESRIPRSIMCSYAQYFSDCAVMGMDSSVAFVQMDREINLKPIFDFVNSRIVKNGFDMRRWLRDPFLAQFHALCFLLSGRFHYRSRQTQPLTLTSSCNPSAETIVQSLYASGQGRWDDSKTTDSDSGSIAYDNITGKQNDRSTVRLNSGAADESEVLSHPLGSCSLPVDSFQALVDTLQQLIAMGKERYLRELDTLRPVLMSSLPRIFASFGAVSLPFTNMNSDIPLELSPTFCAHPLYLPSYESVVAMWQLYTGKKSVVKLSRAVPSPNNRLLRANVFYSLIRHPNSNLPLAHLLMSGGTEWGEEFSKVEERVLAKRAQSQDLFLVHNYYHLD